MDEKITDNNLNVEDSNAQNSMEVDELSTTESSAIIKVEEGINAYDDFLKLDFTPEEEKDEVLKKLIEKETELKLKIEKEIDGIKNLELKGFSALNQKDDDDKGIIYIMYKILLNHIFIVSIIFYILNIWKF